MNQIYPVDDWNVKRFCGMPVHVIMQDGTRHIGILTDCKNGKLMLNGHSGYAPESALVKLNNEPKKKKKNSKQQVKEAENDDLQIQSYTPYFEGGYNGWGGGYNPWGGALLLDLALIAFLFLLI